MGKHHRLYHLPTSSHLITMARAASTKKATPAKKAAPKKVTLAKKAAQAKKAPAKKAAAKRAPTAKAAVEVVTGVLRLHLNSNRHCEATWSEAPEGQALNLPWMTPVGEVMVSPEDKSGTEIRPLSRP